MQIPTAWGVADNTTPSYKIGLVHGMLARGDTPERPQTTLLAIDLFEIDVALLDKGMLVFPTSSITETPYK